LQNHLQMRDDREPLLGSNADGSKTFTSTLKVVVLFICIVWAGYFTNHFTSRLYSQSERAVGVSKSPHHQPEQRLNDKQLATDVLQNPAEKGIASNQLSDTWFTQIQASESMKTSPKSNLQLEPVEHERSVSAKKTSSNPVARTPGPDSTYHFDVELVVILLGSFFGAILLLAWCLAVWRSGGQCCGKKEKLGKSTNSTAEP